ncbi:hypothetical protein EZS27_016963 [termite gut metagenome]|uniref:Uncharacterized protein n=1 Tax=termite gut metagenome TaxID=433724 RepID=A0A5J4RLM8_9ZZZZ
MEALICSSLIIIVVFLIGWLLKENEPKQSIEFKRMSAINCLFFLEQSMRMDEDLKSGKLKLNGIKAPSDETLKELKERATLLKKAIQTDDFNILNKSSKRIKG